MIMGASQARAGACVTYYGPESRSTTVSSRHGPAGVRLGDSKSGGTSTSVPTVTGPGRGPGRAAIMIITGIAAGPQACPAPRPAATPGELASLRLSGILALATEPASESESSPGA